ncbi:MAG: preprotein translocase subunit SecA, partial [Caldilineae bacterium]
VAVIQNAGGGGVDKASFEYDPTYQASDDRYQYLRPITRREAYLCDITYGTNNEFGFDYLRDNMVRDLSRKVQRELHYAIIDEVDNILIDEARTPLIISGQAEESSELYYKFAEVVRPLQPSSRESVEDKEREPDGDYVVDEKARVVYLTEQGIAKVEKRLGIENLYDPEHAPLIPYLDNALQAKVLFKRDKEYVVQNGEVIIVDEFTGRLMYGRRYSEGLHQAIEAKEGLRVQHESFTWATITFQNFFRMYNKLAGMTGTATTEEEEFNKIYNMEVSALPTNVEFRAMQGELIEEKSKQDGVEVTTYRSPDGKELYWKRIDYPDVVYRTPQAKFKAVVEEIKRVHEEGRPVLVGTVAVETSEYLSRLLQRQGIPHHVLNAKNHEKEATIIAQAGQPGAVTIATNMAGRGVDILLGGNPEGLARENLRKQGIDLTTVEPEVWQKALAEATAITERDRKKVVELGGLHVIGTERHEARRIDNQLRGRAGRQGDPGSSRFYVSLQDDLMRRFGGQSVSNLMERLGVDDDMPIEAGLVSKSIENAQSKVEGYNFDIRKHVLEYDDVVNQQREVIYAQRNRILTSPSLKENILSMVQEELSHLVQLYTAAEYEEDWDLPGLYNAVRAILPLPPTMTSRSWAGKSREELEAMFHELAETLYEEKEKQLGAEVLRQIEKHLMLDAVDRLWVRHLTALDALRTGIGLRAYGQQDPLVAYKREAHEMYGMLVQDIQRLVVSQIFHVELAPQPTTRPRNIQTRHDTFSATAGTNGKSRTPIRVEKRPGRNDPCWCGSGKKYKHCHEREDRRSGGGRAPVAAGQGAQSPPAGKSKKRRRPKRRR